MACAVCETRRPRRFCPGVRGDICTTCCGTEREVSIDCPLDCEHLRTSREHERVEPIDARKMPNQDIRVTDDFLREHDALLAHLSRSLVAAALRTPGAVDTDVREALDGLIRTHRTLQSGVYYESRPANPLAGHIYAAVQAAAAEYRQQETRQLGMSRTRDVDVLGVLAFLQRVELDRSNGRRRGRAFVDFLLAFYQPEGGEPGAAPPSLIVP